MKRYIDADRIPFYFRDVGDRVSQYDIRKIAFASEIEDMPTADVVEVRHGEWKVVDRDLGYVEAACSLCRNRVLYYSDPTYHYCPNCGAKMDGDRREE